MIDEKDKTFALEQAQEITEALPSSEMTSKELTPEKLQELTAKLEKDNKKLLTIPPLTQTLLDSLRDGAEILAILYLEIEAKKADLNSKNDLIQTKVNALKDAQKISINEAEFKQSQESIAKYVELLDVVSKEVANEVSYFSQFFRPPPPLYLVVMKDDIDDVPRYLVDKLHWVKKYVKTVRKDLSISFSRYLFGFETQIKKLDYIDMYTKAIQSHKETH